MCILWIRSIVTIFMVSSILTVAHCAEISKRVVSLDNKQKLPLTLEEKSQTVIVIPEKSCNVVRFAGKELQKFLQQSFGDKIPIVSSPDDQKTSIILGDNDFSRKEKIDSAKLPREGFIIKSVGKKIYILGKDSSKVNPEKV